MKHERIGPRTQKNAQPGLLGGSPDYVKDSAANVHLRAALNAAAPCGVRILRDREFGHLLGNPCVIVQREKSRAFVLLRCITKVRHGQQEQTVVDRRPWGWDNPDREFLNPNSPGVERYAQALVKRIHEAGKLEQQRRDRVAACRAMEREAAR